MKNTIIDGAEYAVNLKGEQYEVMIPGTRCPVSAGVLEQWYWEEQLSSVGICQRIKDVYFIDIEKTTPRYWLKKCGIRMRSRSAATKLGIVKGRVSTINDCITAQERSNFSKMNIKSTDTEHLNMMRKKMAPLWEKYREKKKCPVCSKVFSRIKSRMSENSCCSNSCAAKNRDSRKIHITGLACSSCFSATMVLRTRSGEEYYQQFQCSECRKLSRRPIIEFGLRQDLEAAGALDDGRILVSAFVTDKEKATAS